MTTTRAIRLTRQFKRDYRRERKGRHRKTLDAGLGAIVQALAADQPPDPRHRDHALAGAWQGCRDCHLRPDLVLIYRKRGSDVLELIRLGSHSELGL